MRITLDTNFLVSATQWDYSVAHKLLLKLIRQNAQFFTTKDVLQEFSDVLERDFQYTADEATNIIEKVMVFATLIKTTSSINAVKEDPDDNKILECAMDSGSQYNLTYEKQLLNLKEYQGIKIKKAKQLK